MESRLRHQSLPPQFMPSDPTQHLPPNVGPENIGTIPNAPRDRKTPRNKMSCEARKHFLVHDRTPGITEQMERWVQEIQSLIDLGQGEDDCWLHPGPPRLRIRNRVKGSVTKKLTWRDANGRHTVEVNYGIIVLLLKDLVTDAQKEGFIVKSWHLSHLCDLQRPECGQCIKFNRDCTGYRREITFLNTTHESHLTGESSSNSLGQVEGINDNTTGEIIPSSSKLEVGLVKQRPREPPVPKLPAFVNGKNAFRTQFFGAFMEGYLPEGIRGNRNPLSWVEIIPDILNPGEALSDALSALSVARIGRLEDDSNLARAAMSLYGKALWELQRALWDETLMYRDETLAASMVLGMYEVLFGQNVTAWLSHGGGTARLIQLRGPQLHQTPLAHQLFLGYRFTGVVQGVHKSEATFLEKQEWMTIPWEGTSKPAEQGLLDLMCQLPGILEKAGNIGSLPNSPETIADSLRLVSRCWELNTSIEHWQKDMKVLYPTPHYWPEFSTMHNPANDSEYGKVFPIAFHFTTLRLAHSYLLYWTSLQLLWSTISDLYDSISNYEPYTQKGVHRVALERSRTSEGFTFHSGYGRSDYGLNLSSLPSLTEKHDVMGCSQNIAQSMEYCMREEVGNLGTYMAMLSLPIALRSYMDERGKEKETQWCFAMFEMLNSRVGLSIGKQLEGLPRLDLLRRSSFP
ncbi:MAG: hypothetical protein M1827_007279 [Pycnora praestabilis]|nr:MAG: hypothetical protein M1827_007279 [Pycnora praestabilis]